VRHAIQDDPLDIGIREQWVRAGFSPRPGPLEPAEPKPVFATHPVGHSGIMSVFSQIRSRWDILDAYGRNDENDKIEWASPVRADP
jgi:hypothetical protein